MHGNVIVGQSGGPTAVINSSLAGVFRTAIDRGAKKVYGMRNGIQGLLDEKYVDLSNYIKNELDIEILKRTPSAFLGTCRYKLPAIHEDQEIYKRIFEILDKLKIECFIYIGGNDSMDTIKKLSDYAMLTGASQKFVGVPKTIDNDLALTDHTPGYGSAAKYIATSTKEIIRDGNGFSYKKEQVTIIEIMGRNAGWLTGAAALAKGEDCEGVDLIYLPEVPFDIDKFLEKVKHLLAKKSTVFVAISEGIKLKDGTYVSEAGGGSDYLPGQPCSPYHRLQDPCRRVLHSAEKRFPSGLPYRYQRGIHGRRRRCEGSRRRRLRHDGRYRPRLQRSVPVRYRRIRRPQDRQRREAGAA